MKFWAWEHAELITYICLYPLKQTLQVCSRETHAKTPHNKQAKPKGHEIPWGWGKSREIESNINCVPWESTQEVSLEVEYSESAIRTEENKETADLISNSPTTRGI